MGSAQALEAQRIADRDGAVFRARGLTKTSLMGEVEVHALRSVDLDRYRGEFAVILGPSGSGTSWRRADARARPHAALIARSRSGSK